MWEYMLLNTKGVSSYSADGGVVLFPSLKEATLLGTLRDAVWPLREQVVLELLLDPKMLTDQAGVGHDFFDPSLCCLALIGVIPSE